MIKVMCIYDSWNPADGTEPIFGEICTVFQSAKYDIAYSVCEHPVNASGVSQSFVKYAFAPLSDIDELEIARSREAVGV